MSILASARDGRVPERAAGAVLVDTGAGQLVEGLFRGLGVLEEVGEERRRPGPARPAADPAPDHARSPRGSCGPSR
jgi:hypothetical protein